ncbi:succinyl-CoA synthetase alpha subunit [Micromonospora pallida]|uniref:Succinyl-CoA synthetase alpha subunit n=1 Tax=Micromonospora pallida TaxID=145854 RepID=A0A1C6RS40_9ACTN|nr:CoA-binding protein [Micromonospora pallida]SCL20041.1 succinyl-CoA synthetase alpha subunit [Micromonospora pallida]
MTFLIDRDTRVLIQGITGTLGRFVVSMMAGAGLAPVAGVTPGRGGTSVDGVPVFDTIDEARRATGADASLVLVPAAGLRDAVLEAIDERLSTVALMVDGVPLGLSLDLISAAADAGVTLVGPNSPGVIAPGRCLLGALDPRRFTPGRVAIVSRSGGMMSTLAHTLTAAGFGQSTCVGIGGDSVIGLDMPAALRLAEADPDTDATVVFGEIGTTQEERVAALIAAGQLTKPIVVYIAGRAAPPGIRYSHAGAQSEGNRGTAASKIETLRTAGALIAERYTDVPRLLARARLSAGAGAAIGSSGGDATAGGASTGSTAGRG